MQKEIKEPENEKEIQKELEKKERLIQTCIVIYGLLLVYNQNLNDEAQAASLFIFIFFLTFAMEYYKSITLPKNKKSKFTKIIDRIRYTNAGALFTSLFFSFAIMIYAYSILQKIQIFNGLSGIALSIVLGTPIALTMNDVLKF